MGRTLADIFKDNPTVEVIEWVNYNDGGPFGLSDEKRRLKICDEFARELAELPGANTEAGYITEDGHYVYGSGGYDINTDSHRYRARVYRVPAGDRTVK